jgi:hypothetical protein
LDLDRGAGTFVEDGVRDEIERSSGFFSADDDDDDDCEGGRRPDAERSSWEPICGDDTLEEEGMRWGLGGAVRSAW